MLRNGIAIILAAIVAVETRRTTLNLDVVQGLAIRTKLVGRVLRSFTRNRRSRIRRTPRHSQPIMSEGDGGLEGGAIVLSSSVCASRITGVCKILVGLRLCP